MLLPVLPEPVVEPVLEPVPEPLPDIEEPDPEPLPIEAFVSIQLLPEPVRHPVTVTVRALELLALVDPV